MITLYLINIIISLLIFLVTWIIKKKRDYIGLVIILSLPFFGVFLYLTILFLKKICSSELWNESSLSHLPTAYDYSEISMTNLVVSNTKDIIPVQDALVLNDEKIKRSVIINALKGDSYQYLDFLMKALKDKDTETSHYAATAVTEIKRNLTLSIQDLEQQYNDNKSDLSALSPYADVLKKYNRNGLLDTSDLTVMISYADALKKYNNSGLLDKSAYKKNLVIYKNLLEEIVITHKSQQYFYEEVINTNIELEDFDKAVFYCHEFFRQFKNNETPYLLMMKMCFIKKNKTMFNSELQKLRESNVILSKDTLKLIRFWLEGEANA